MKLIRRAEIKGLSIIELVVSLFLLFLASSFVMGMFLSASGAPKRLQKAGELEQLASLKMDEIMASPLGTLPNTGSGVFSELPGYTYTISTKVTDFDADMLSVLIVASAPDGQKRKLVGLKPARTPVPPPPPPPETAFDLPQWDLEPVDEGEDPQPVIPPVILDPPQVVMEQGCLSCHGGTSPTAPLWGINTITANANAAQAPNPVSYVKTSIWDPDAYVVPGYGYTQDPGGDEYSTMAGFKKEDVSDAEATKIANWILSGRTNYDAPYPPLPPADGGETVPASF